MKKAYLLLSSLVISGMALGQPPICQITPTHGERCDAGTVDLSAAAANDVTIKWYDASTAGNLLHEGSTFTTPNLTQSTTYYLEGETSGVGGPTQSYVINDNLVPDRNWATNIDHWGINFTVHEEMTLDSLAVYPLGTGTITIIIRDRNNNNAIVEQVGPINVSGTGYTGSKVFLPLDIELDPGDYLLGQSHTGITNIGSQNIGNTNYPYATPLMTLTSGSQSLNSETSVVYYWFYDINISSIGGSSEVCTDSRVPITATINETPSFDFDDYTEPICHTEFPLTISPDYGTSTITDYSWSNGAMTPTTSVIDGGQYILTVSNNGCEFTDTVDIVKDNRVTSIQGFVTEVIDADNRMFEFAANNPIDVEEYLWDFGDGNSGTGEIVTHQYGADGTYTITLTAVGACNNDDDSKTLDVDGSIGINELDQSIVNIYPNPVKDHFTIELDNHELMNQVEVINMEGRVVESIAINALSKINVKVNDWVPGIYMLKITTNNNEILTHKILIK